MTRERSRFPDRTTFTGSRRMKASKSKGNAPEPGPIAPERAAVRDRFGLVKKIHQVILNHGAGRCTVTRSAALAPAGAQDRVNLRQERVIPSWMLKSGCQSR
jgi:hypothetical protein